MIRRSCFLIAPLLLGLSLLLGCSMVAGKTHRNSNVKLSLVSFGETDGELKDCGCHVNPTGGLARRATLVDSLRSEKIPFVVLDAGNFVNDDRDAGELKTRFIWQMMEEMGYSVTCPGTREISDWKLYHELTSSSPVKSVATNLTAWEDGKRSPAGLRYAIVEVGGVRVGIFSLISSTEVDHATPPAGIRFEASDPLATARTVVPELGEKADLVILASQMSDDQTNRVLEQVPGIDIAVYGKQPAWIEEPRIIGTTITQRTGTRGTYAGDLDLVVDPDGKIVDWHSRNAALGARIREEPEVAALVEQTETKAEEMVIYGQPDAAPPSGR